MTIAPNFAVAAGTAANTIRAAAHPVTFSKTVGLYQPGCAAGSSVAVLFAAPWGLEEICLRKFWRITAERLSDAGIPSLRFDYPGTGDALDQASYPDGLKTWEDSLVAAAGHLKTFSGCRGVVVVSQGLGCAIAARAASRIDGLEAVAFLAPVVSGRTYLREIQFWSKMVDDGLGLSEAQRMTEGVTIAGLTMPAEIAADVRKLNLTELDTLPARQCLVAKRPDRLSDAAFAEQLGTLGADVTQADYRAYDDLVSNSAVPKAVPALFGQVVEWVKGLDTGRMAAATGVPEAVPAMALLAGTGFQETPLVFGSGKRLYGVLCEPLGERRGATVVFLSAAYDRHAGWGRSIALMARRLAADGIASLRFDAANVGDSPPTGGAEEQVLYGSSQIRDVREALDLIDSRGLFPAIVSGRCSGAYLAFHSAVVDSRAHGLITVNPYVFHWDARMEVNEVVQYQPRSLGVYGDKMFRTETLRRLLQGSIDIRAAAGNMLKALGRRIVNKLGPLTRQLPGRWRRTHTEILKSFRSLSERKVRFHILYSENDVGYEHLLEHFGKGGKGLNRFANTQLTMIEDADHNLTPEAARQAYYEAVRDMALSFEPPFDR